MYSKWHAIRAIDETKQFTTATDSEGNEIVTWADGETPISDSDINAKVTELKNAYDAEEWKRNREAEYPSHDDCIHALLDGGDTLTDLQAKRTATKNKYPKPE
jgi:hypothetical protein